ncbi:SGNH/GDSL hydrolase family protein [Schleiferilactobacillus perolens]|jgi:acyl-CoA thioesterase-1|uniref:SGNH/GDSL hydrolase family protein n=1 Tax=Schleiferilactobacillus perolens TaxID=100468 RepID=UPI003B59DF8E
MRRFNRFLVILSLLLVTVGTLAACQKPVSKSGQSVASTTKTRKKPSKKSSTSKKETATKPVAPTLLDQLEKKSGQTLVYSPFGDSVSVGLFADSKQSRFTTLFAHQLARATGKQVTEQGVAVVGKTAANLGVPQVQTIVNQHPDIVTIEFGTNDAVGGKAPATLAAFKSQLTQIVTTLQQQTQAELILMTTWTPASGMYDVNDAAYDAEIKAVGQETKTPVLDLAPIWQNHPEVVGPPGQNIPDFATWGSRDQYHPNQVGHDRIAAALMNLIQQGEK